MSDLEWFTEWVWKSLTLGLTFAKGSSPAEMFAAFGVEPDEPIEPRSFLESVDADDAILRVGQQGDWTYAVEHVTTQGFQRLDALSAGGREAFALLFTQGICLFMYARDGTTINGLDLTVPHIRYGTDGHYFDAALAEVGISSSEPIMPAAAARLVEAVFGLEMTQDMFERPLASVGLRG
jgi:hypothetical protein